MEAEIYVDLYFLINTSMDFLCLLITGRLLHARMGTGRLLLAAAVGGFYAVLSLLLAAGGVLGLLADCAAALLISAVAFASRGIRLRRIFLSSAVFALISMVQGGLMTALYVLLNRLELPLGAIGEDTLSAWIFGGVALAAGLLTLRGGRAMGISSRVEAVEVRARLLGREVALNAMVDSGNLLVDPVSGRGVIVAERRALASALPRQLLGEGRAGEREAMEYIRANAEIAARVRLIPTKTASGGGILVAILPDSVTLKERGGLRSADYLVAAGSVGGEGFDALIPRI